MHLFRGATFKEKNSTGELIARKVIGHSTSPATQALEKTTRVWSGQGWSGRNILKEIAKMYLELLELLLELLLLLLLLLLLHVFIT